MHGKSITKSPHSFLLFLSTYVIRNSLNLVAFLLQFASSHQWEVNFLLSLRLDHHGRLLRCNHNEGCRLEFLGVPVEKTHEMYKAYYSLTKRLKDPKNMFLHKLSPGEMIVFDNDRVLHGREGYTLSEEGGRCLESAYIDWDVARSRLSVLGKRLGKGPVARMDSKLSVTGQWSVS